MKKIRKFIDPKLKIQFEDMNYNEIPLYREEQNE